MPVAAVIPFSWTGFYAGINVGYAWGDPEINSGVASAVTGTTGGLPIAAASAASSGKAHSGVGGFQVGYNIQQGWWVYGVEADASITRLQTVALPLSALAFFSDGANQASMNSTTRATASIDWFGTLRGRLGYAWNRALIYGTGGLAYGSVRLNDAAFFNGFCCTGGNGTAFNGVGAPLDNGTIRVGWAAGGGIDYAYTHNIIVSFTYLHVDLGDKLLTGGFAFRNPVGNGTLSTGTATTRADFSFDEVRVAASWKL